MICRTQMGPDVQLKHVVYGWAVSGAFCYKKKNNLSNNPSAVLQTELGVQETEKQTTSLYGIIR